MAKTDVGFVGSVLGVIQGMGESRIRSIPPQLVRDQFNTSPRRWISLWAKLHTMAPASTPAMSTMAKTRPMNKRMIAERLPNVVDIGPIPVGVGTQLAEFGPSWATTGQVPPARP